MADPAAPTPAALTPEQVKANKQAYRQQDTKQLVARMQAGMSKDGVAGAKAAFTGIPGFHRGGFNDTSGGSAGGHAYKIDPNYGMGDYKYKLPYPTTPAAATGGPGPAIAPQAAPAAAAAPVVAQAAPAGSLADAVSPQQQRTSGTAVYSGSKSRTRAVGGVRGGGVGGGMF